MAGTQKITEVAGGLITNFVLATDPGADVEQSLDGIDISGLQNGATCYVRALDTEYLLRGAVLGRVHVHGRYAAAS